MRSRRTGPLVAGAGVGASGLRAGWRNSAGVLPAGGSRLGGRPNLVPWGMVDSPMVGWLVGGAGTLPSVTLGTVGAGTVTAGMLPSLTRGTVGTAGAVAAGTAAGTMAAPAGTAATGAPRVVWQQVVSGW